MRIDKYLKVSRLVKRRTVAKEIVDGGAILINGRKSKPSSEVVVGDIIDLRLGKHQISAKVLSIGESARKEQAADMYEILRDEARS